MGLESASQVVSDCSHHAVFFRLHFSPAQFLALTKNPIR